MDDSAYKPKRRTDGWFETLRFALLAIIIVLVVRAYIAQPFIVSGDSMVPTFESGEYLIVDEISYRFHPPERGDVIIMRYPLNPKKYFIKRIIGLPGETLEFAGSTITVTDTQGEHFVLDEPYVERTRPDFLKVMLDANEYYVLGDNRSASSDSRIWGALPAANIIGRPIVRLFPPSATSWLPGTVEVHP